MAKKFNPLDTKVKSKEKAGVLSFVEASPDVKEAIDNYCSISQEISKLEGLKKSYSLPIQEAATSLFCSRMMSKDVGNIKLQGNQGVVTYIVQNSSSALTEEDVQKLVARFGDKVAEELVETDIASLKLNPAYIAKEENQKKLFAALQKSFTAEELENIFTPVTSKVVDNVVEKAVDYAKSSEELADLYKFLKIKNYVKA